MLARAVVWASFWPSHCSAGRIFHRVLMTASSICNAKYYNKKTHTRIYIVKKSLKKKNHKFPVQSTLVCWLFEYSRIVSTRVQASGCCFSWVKIWSAIRCWRGKEPFLGKNGLENKPTVSITIKTIERICQPEVHGPCKNMTLRSLVKLYRVFARSPAAAWRALWLPLP